MIRIGPLQVCLEQRRVTSNGEAVHLGSRAFDILERLIAANGELVSNDEIMRCAWPDTIVEENNIQVHIASLRKALGKERGLIRTVWGRGYSLLLAKDAGLEEPAVRRVPFAEPHDCVAHAPPAARSTLIGRQRAIDEVTALLGASRIVTLAGSGGVGKTRLAVEVSRRMMSSFEGGVAFVDFGPVHGGRLALEVLANALGVTTPATGISATDIALATRNRCALVVLDNCEHVLEEMAKCVEAMVEVNREIRILVTSMEPLRVLNEVLYRVASLDVPDEGATTDDILCAESVQLFRSRTLALDPACQLETRDIAQIGLICRSLDGNPLAIELAAARAAALGVEVLAAHLDDRFRVLTGGYRTALPRHQTLKASLDWSYLLLNDAERTLIRGLSVFVNPLSFDAACRVGQSRGLTPGETLDALAGLVGKSLVIHENAGAVARYRLLETTRAYARQRLDETGELRAACLTHASYMVELLERAQEELYGSAAAGRLEACRDQADNLRAALAWALAPSGDRTLAARLSAAVGPILSASPFVTGGRAHAHPPLAAISGDGMVSVDANHAKGLPAALEDDLVEIDGFDEPAGNAVRGAEARVARRRHEVRVASIA